MAEIFDAKEAWRRTVEVVKSKQLTIEQVMDKIQSAINSGDNCVGVIIGKDVEKQLKKLKYKIFDSASPGRKIIQWGRGKIK